MNNTAAAPTIDFMVDTKCGRHFRWSATDMHSLFRELQEKGYVAEKVLTMEEYKAEELKESA